MNRREFIGYSVGAVAPAAMPGFSLAKSVALASPATHIRGPIPVTAQTDEPFRGNEEQQNPLLAVLPQG